MPEDSRDAAGGERDRDDLVVPLLEEEVRVEKRYVETGKVRVSTVVDTIEEQARAVLEGDSFDIQRVPVDRVVDQAPTVRTENGVMIVPVLEEVLFVEKRLVLKEEIHIRRQRTTETVELPVTLRKQRAVVEHLSEDQISNAIEERDP